MAKSATAMAVEIRRYQNSSERSELTHSENDAVAVESPLEIRVEGKSVAIVMRTPGDDPDLVAGFLLTEGMVSSPADFFEITLCPANQGGNVADVVLRDPSKFDLERLSRHVFTSSSCGVCGKATIDAAFLQFPPLNPEEGAWKMPIQNLLEWPALQRAEQTTFEATGGLHASTLFDLAGVPVLQREDVGRHNALDKVLGSSLLGGLLPLQEHGLLLSGRVSFELMQKALAGRIPLIAAVGAPSSLAVEFARDSGQTLIGFLRDGRCNIYAGAHRLSGMAS